MDAREWIPLETFLHDALSVYERSWSISGAIGWIWQKLVEYSSDTYNDPLPYGRFVLRSNVEVRLYTALFGNDRKQLPRLLNMQVM